MTRRFSRSHVLTACGLLLVCLLAGPGVASAAEHPRKEMDEVFEALSHLLPLSLDEQTWADPDNRAEIASWLAKLAGRTATLEQHAELRDAGFRHLSRSLSADVQEIKMRFEAERFEESRFFMIEATGNCVACHSRLPDARGFPLGDRLLDKIDLEKLSSHEKTQILVATRQFDRALDVWEKAFLDPEESPSALDIGGYFLDYLTIALRVQRDPGRVERTLRAFRKRKDLPRYLHHHVDGWLRALAATKGELQAKDRLGHARVLVVGQDDRERSPLGREQVIYDLIASSLLLQFIDSAPESELETAEAFYLLGVVESRSVDSYWVPQAELHLETAIRLAPAAPFADHAYAVLEEYIVVGYGGASGGELPADAWTRLNELRELIESSQSKPAAK